MKLEKKSGGPQHNCMESPRDNHGYYVIIVIVLRQDQVHLHDLIMHIYSA